MNVILHPGRKSEVESDAYGSPKCSSSICENDDEATNEMGHNIQRTWFEKIKSKVIVHDVLLYGRTAEQIQDYF